MSPFLDTLAGFALNFAIIIVIVRFLYFPQAREKRYVFTLVAFNTIVYFVMGLLNRTDLSIGVGFGLFAIFSVLRYRTDTIPIRDMTYLFVLIALPVLNSILLNDQSFPEFAVANLATVSVLFVLERGWGFSYETRKTVIYERIDLIRPEHWTMLMADLKERTGLPIKRIEIGTINFLRDTAELTLVCDTPREHGTVTYVSTSTANDDD